MIRTLNPEPYTVVYWCDVCRQSVNPWSHQHKQLEYLEIMAAKPNNDKGGE